MSQLQPHPFVIRPFFLDDLPAHFTRQPFHAVLPSGRAPGNLFPLNHNRKSQAATCAQSGQPAPYLDPTVYCSRYATGPLDSDLEITGPLALYLDASIDIDDTNWMADLVDVDPKGNRQWVSAGYLKAAYRAVDEGKSRPYQPIHPRQDPVPVPSGEIVKYAIAMMPTSNVFKKGHSIELIIRNQDDLLSRLGTWGVYHLPFMRTVTHTIHFGQSHLLLPVIPSPEKQASGKGADRGVKRSEKKKG